MYILLYLSINLHIFIKKDGKKSVFLEPQMIRVDSIADI